MFTILAGTFGPRIFVSTELYKLRPTTSRTLKPWKLLVLLVVDFNMVDKIILNSFEIFCKKNWPAEKFINTLKSCHTEWR